ncbi:hypothetical protein THAOC_18975, partial [Thalassiosira oceanica]
DIREFDPLGLGEGWDLSGEYSQSNGSRGVAPVTPIGMTLSTLGLGLAVAPGASNAESTPLSTGEFNPDSFKPVCSASDGFYRFLQGSTRAVVGDDNFSEYGPLIAGGLLRIRLELCVVESFFNEAVGPFIQKNGLNWILPLHETVETFIAGSIFALATTFILVGSTKLVQIIAFYGDLLFGGPCRLLGGFFFDRARGKPVTLDVSFFGFFKTRVVGPPVDFKEEELRKAEEKLIDFENVKPTDIPLLAISGGVKVFGEASKIFRDVVDGLDLFVGRYLVLLSSGYVIFKFIHFKIFPGKTVTVATMDQFLLHSPTKAGSISSIPGLAGIDWLGCLPP